MSAIETYYLIDFENINDERLNGCSSLGKHDHVHLFYTDNARRLNLDIFHGSISCEFSVHKVPVHKQSLDMHLVSYLGYLLGSSQDENSRYIIISDDTDYDNVISFWKEKTSRSISRRSSIAIPEIPPKTDSNKQDTASKNQDTASTKEPGNGKAAIADNKTSLNTEIMQAVTKSGYPTETANKTAALAVSHLSDETSALSNIHNQLRAEYNDDNALYKIVKPIFNKYFALLANARGSSSAPDTADKIQKSLHDAKFSDTVVREVVSLVCRYQSEANAKQSIYRSIIAKYGQKQGLPIYNHIKKYI